AEGALADRLQFVGRQRTGDLAQALRESLPVLGGEPDRPAGDLDHGGRPQRRRIPPSRAPKRLSTAIPMTSTTSISASSCSAPERPRANCSRCPTDSWGWTMT